MHKIIEKKWGQKLNHQTIVSVDQSRYWRNWEIVSHGVEENQVTLDS